MHPASRFSPAALWAACRRLPSGRRFDLGLALALLLVGVVYTAACWSPSSYALALRQVGAAADGLVAGTPRDIRLDEYLVYTPLFQATVNNGYTRVNTSSLYREDLRSFFSFPVADWGLAFKPTMWGFRLLDPARAYSLHFYAVMALFVGGYALLFRALGGGRWPALLAALGLFFTQFTQMWLTTDGVTLALFPWVLLCLDLRVPWAGRLALFYWVATCWLVASFYPPFIISLAFVGLVYLVAFRRGHLRPRRLAGLVLATAASAGTAAFYLRDYLRAAADTVYPGRRVVGGGTEPVWKAVGHFLPTVLERNHLPTLAGLNLGHIAVLGSVYLLLALAFARWGRLFRRGAGGGAPERLPFVALGLGVAATAAWAFVPLPSWVGVPLLWDRVPGFRLFIALGLLLFLLAFLAASRLGLCLSWPRLAAVTVVVAAGGGDFKLVPFGHGHPLRLALTTWLDWGVLLPAAALVALRRRLPERARHPALLAVGLAFGVVAFGGFNPLQSSRPIFHREATPLTRHLDRMAAANHGVVWVPGSMGTVLNGLGYRAVNHYLMVPRMDFWRALFPDIPEARLDAVFNRTHHVVVRPDVAAPAVFSESAVVVPEAALKAADWPALRARMAAAPPWESPTGAPPADAGRSP